MAYTLGDIKGLVLADLHRKASDTTFPAATLTAKINSARRRAWRQVGGNIPDTVYHDLLSGVRDYALAEATDGISGVASVSVRDTSGGRPRALKPATAEELYAIPGYPVTGDTSAPTRYLLRRPGFTSGGSPGALTLTLYPTPAATIANGLLVETMDATLLLSTDTDLSELPASVDELAAHMAAMELALLVVDEEPTLAALPLLAQLKRDAERAAKDDVSPYPDRPLKLRPGVKIGPQRGKLTYQGSFMSDIYGSVGTRRITRATATTTDGATTATIPLTEAVAADGVEGVLIFSDEQGFLRRYAVADDRMSIRVSVRGGHQFYGETVTAFYETEAPFVQNAAADLFILGRAILGRARLG